jgi:aspartate aminotransferase-like enzyme
MEMRLMTPGPTPLPKQVIDALGRQVTHHRTAGYGEMFGLLCENLKYVFNTEYPVLTFTASGTGGMEAAVVNCFQPGDKVVLVSTGVFSERFANICSAMGLTVDKLDVAWGHAVEPDELGRHLSGDVKGVIVTHNETSTGVANDIASIGRLLKDKEILYIVDVVSSLGGMEVRPEEWGIDVAITSSQKALMCPPGLTFLAVSPRAIDISTGGGSYRHYWDFGKALDFIRKDPPFNPFTPAVNLVEASNTALGLIRKEGLENVWARHDRMANMTREGIRAIGLQLFADDCCASKTVTSIKVPEGIKAKDIVDRMKEMHGIVIAGGNGSLKGKIIRIAHMGYINEADVLASLEALDDVLMTLGFRMRP